MSFGLMAGLAGISGLVGAGSANAAAKAQEKAAKEAAKVQRYMFDTSRQDAMPFLEGGQNALAALQYELGLAPRPGSMSGEAGSSGANALGEIVYNPAVQGSSGVRFVGEGEKERAIVNGRVVTENVGNSVTRDALRRQYPGVASSPESYSFGGQNYATRAAAEAARSNASGGGDFRYRGFQNTPGYGYALEQNQKALERMAAARGVRMSGATLAEAGRQAQGLQNQDYSNFLNRLSGLSGTGQTASAQLGSLGANAGRNIGSAYMNAGAARASGYEGMNNALQGTMSNLYGLYGMNQAGMFQ